MNVCRHVKKSLVFGDGYVNTNKFLVVLPVGVYFLAYAAMTDDSSCTPCCVMSLTPWCAMTLRLPWLLSWMLSCEVRQDTVLQLLVLCLPSVIQQRVLRHGSCKFDPTDLIVVSVEYPPVLHTIQKSLSFLVMAVCAAQTKL